MSPLVLLKVEPTHTERRQVFVDWTDDATGMPTGELREMYVPVYPPSTRGKELREARRNALLGFTDGATRLGISVVQLSALERGVLTLSEEEWPLAIAAMAQKGG